VFNINTLKTDGPTVFDDIRGESTAKTDLATLLFDTINNLNQSSYRPRDKVTRDPGFINIWLQYPNEIIENTNRIRDPEVYFSDGHLIPNIFYPTGSLLSWYA
jgi:hypothetical protein